MPPTNETPAPVSVNTPPVPQKKPVGPTVGAIIIVIMLIFGALYFWGASLNREAEQLPLIPGDAGAAQ